MATTTVLARPLALSIDLDEHFATASDEERDELLAIFESTEEPVKLVYTSHGPAEDLIALAAKSHLPVPYMFLADSGTTALKGDGDGTIEPLQRNIIQLWPGKEAMTKALSELSGVKSLDDEAPCRQMVEIDSEEALEAARTRVESMGCSIEIRVGNQYDILPYGVNKGTSLGRWAVQENVQPNHFVTMTSAAGDFCICGRGWRAAVFQGAPDSLKNECGRFHNVRLLSADGPKGVVEALQHAGWLEQAQSA